MLARVFYFLDEIELETDDEKAYAVGMGDEAFDFDVAEHLGATCEICPAKWETLKDLFDEIKRGLEGPKKLIASKYNNPDPNCGHPFVPENEPIAYCWSYASHVDGTPGYEDMESICKNCEMHKNIEVKP
jgi:hypothetical protein